MSGLKSVTSSGAAAGGDLIAALSQPVTSGAPSSTAAAPLGGATNLIAALSEPLATSSVQEKARHVATRIQSDAWQLAHEVYIAPFPKKRTDSSLNPPIVSEFRPPAISDTLSPEALENHRFGYRARQYVFLSYELADGTLGELIVENPTAERIEEAIDRFLGSVSANAETAKTGKGLVSLYGTTLSGMKGDKEKVATLYKQAVRNIFLPQVANEAMGEYLISPLRAIVIGYCGQTPSVPFIYEARLVAHYEARLVANYMSKDNTRAALIKRGIEPNRAIAVATLAAEVEYMRALMMNPSSFSWEETLAIYEAQGQGVSPGEEEAEMSYPLANSNIPLTPQAYLALTAGSVWRDQAVSEQCWCHYCRPKRTIKIG
jgi:hypothetical protein